MIDDNKYNNEKVKQLEEKLEEVKQSIHNSKSIINEKEREISTYSDAANRVDILKTENLNLIKKIDLQSRKAKSIKDENE
jgi:hypothetical protein